MKTFSQIFKAFCPPTVLYFVQYFLELFFRIYERYPSFDIPMHFLGGVTIALTGNSLLQIAQKEKWLVLKSRLVQSILLVSFVALFAILWEFHEFLMDKFLGTQTQPSIADTMKDMFLGLLGACVFSITKIFSKKKPV
jgi:hypothetical protein